MLTKDLILCRVRSGRIYPKQVNVEDAGLLELASQILSLYDVSTSPLRGQIEETMESLVNGQSAPMIAKGFWKLIDDNAEFSSPVEVNYPAERKQLFTEAAKVLRSGMVSNEEDYHAQIRVAVGQQKLLDSGAFYADLPENDRLTHFKTMNARQVLERYNVAQVQGLVIHSSRLYVQIWDEEPSRLRRLFKYLKFFKLLSRVKRNVDGSLTLSLDGPASVLEHSKRYGLELAEFFPAVCTLQRWEARADVWWRDVKSMLVVDNSMKLVCPYHNFVAYAPQEIQLFEDYFKQTATTWSLQDEIPFLDGVAGEVFFPDFCFRHNQTGKEIYLELFHRWHDKQLKERLEFMAQHGDLPMIIGVDKSLLKDAELQELLDSSAWFAQRGFLFRDYPTVEKTLSCLNQTLDA